MNATADSGRVTINTDSKDTAAGYLPLVSVVIPVRNDAERLKRCLDSLAAQSYPGDRFEIIIIDNGSNDASPTVAAEHGAIVPRHPGLRVGALRNRGVNAASGDILAFVDSDHEVPQHWLARGATELAHDNELLMIGSPCVAPPRGTWVQRTWELHRTRGASRRRVEWLGAGNMFMRRKDFLAVQGFDESLIAAEDVDLCVRVAELPGTIVSDMRITNIHHGEPRTLSDFFWKEYWRGSSGLLAFFRHGMPLHELPSLVFPLYHLIGCIGLVAIAVISALTGQPLWIPLLSAMLALGLPSLLFGLKTACQVRHFWAAPQLVALYFTYGVARALALFKA